MPKEKYGDLEYNILEYLYKSEKPKSKWDSFENVAQYLGKKSIPSYTIENMAKKKVIKIREILNIKAMRITKKGKRVFESRFIEPQPPIKRIDITVSFYRNRFRNPGKYMRFLTAKPGASKSFNHKIGRRADSISKGSQVVMGFTKSNKWEVQGVLITLDKKPEKNQELAIRIFNDIEKWLGDRNG